MSDVSSIPDADLLRRSLRYACGRRGNLSRPTWAVAMDAFTIGSTYAWQLCVRLGVNPDAIGKEQSRCL